MFSFLRRNNRKPAKSMNRAPVRLRLEELEDRVVPSVDMGPIVNPANGHTYYRLTPSTWTEAESQAVALGGHLVTINDATENLWVSNTFGQPTQWGLWIGLNDVATEGHYVWASGETAGYRNWSPTYGQPDNFNNEDYVHLWNPAIGAGNSGWAWNDFLNWTYATPPNSYPSQGVVEVNTKPDLAVSSLTWNAQGGVDIGYKISGANLAQPSNVALYWSADASFDKTQDTPALQPGVTLPTQTAQSQTAYSITVASNQLTTPPAGKPYLLAVIDPNNTVAESDEQGGAMGANNVRELQIADVEVSSARLQDSKTVAFNYVTTGNPGPFAVGVYRSTDALFDTNDLLVASTLVTTPSAPAGSPWTITLSDEMPLDPARKYVLIVADPTRGISELNEDNNTSSFRKLALGVVTHGLQPTGSAPDWMFQMASELEHDGYYETIAFDWSSRSWQPIPHQTVIAGQNLATNIRTTIAQMATQPNDVVDLHVIGHSRGAVVISQALINLDTNPGSVALTHGYVKMTMLDPHPGRNQGALSLGILELLNGSGVSHVGNFSFNPLSGVSRSLAIGTLTFQSQMRDPEIIIPKNVDSAESYYQQLPWYLGSSFTIASGLNLWGVSPSSIRNPSSRPFTATLVNIPGIGHTEIAEWYLNTYIR